MLSFDVDVVILGGGIGGLWLLNRLCARGYNAVLLESDQLGGGQSINSQGMIHGGIKYALSGMLTGSSEAIADMPEHWRRCLRGAGDVDLRGVNVLSDHFYLWSTESLTSRLTSFFASKLTRGRVETVAASERHPVFQHADFHGNLYKLVDMVLDVPSVIRKLADNCRGRIYRADAASMNFERAADGSIVALQFLSAATPVRIAAQRFVFSAGEGNEALLQKIGSKAPATQRRPLQQLLIKHDYPYPLYAHCTGSNPSPRLTISSHPLQDGKWVWYLGGDLATEGVALDAATLIAKGKQELYELLPWIDFSNAEWATLRIDRAEPKQKGLVKPDKAFAAVADNCPNVIVAWPTKLTLAPNMADEVDALLALEPSAPPLPTDAETLSRPEFAKPCWEWLF
ncbi:MAG TPA: FAD-dependent oxidoreductase [Spongiibacteraceae bacterium]|nr:FAD-dependent oxidoreductase [Spongiibacteraceae bacterium]